MASPHPRIVLHCRFAAPFISCLSPLRPIWPFRLLATRAIHSTPQLGSIGFGHSGDGDGNIFMSENMRRAASTGPWAATQYIYIWLKQLHVCVCVCVCCSVVITLLLYRFVRESRESEAKQKERKHFVQRSHCRRRRRRRIIAVVRRQFTSNRKYCQDLLLFTSNYYCYC